MVALGVFLHSWVVCWQVAQGSCGAHRCVKVVKNDIILKIFVRKFCTVYSFL